MPGRKEFNFVGLLVTRFQTGVSLQQNHSAFRPRPPTFHLFQPPPLSPFTAHNLSAIHVTMFVHTQRAISAGCDGDYYLPQDVIKLFVACVPAVQLNISLCCARVIENYDNIHKFCYLCSDVNYRMSLYCKQLLLFSPMRILN
jgi:hypothetical protein